MKTLIVEGGSPLRGEVGISGAKNAALAILPAVLLCEQPCTIYNLPLIDDVFVLERMLSALGAKVMRQGHAITVDPRGVCKNKADPLLACKMRASYYLLSVFLSRFGSGEVCIPGGCRIGKRPIDQSLKVWKALGGHIVQRDNTLMALPSVLKGNEVYFDLVSVGATVNGILTAVKAPGETVLYNVSKEPYVVDLIGFLNAMGARIQGAGSDVIVIKGVPALGGGEYTLIPDPIEAGTLMLMAAATRGNVTLLKACPAHVKAVTAKLREMGACITVKNNTLHISCSRSLCGTQVKTLPYPGFPTDLQQPITALLTTCPETSTVTETIYEARFKYVEELMKMGANITLSHQQARITAVPYLKGCDVKASDLRAGAALMLAALMARGQTRIFGAHYINRGYEGFCEKLQRLGAQVAAVENSDTAC